MLGLKADEEEEMLHCLGQKADLSVTVKDQTTRSLQQIPRDVVISAHSNPTETPTYTSPISKYLESLTNQSAYRQKTLGHSLKAPENIPLQPLHYQLSIAKSLARLLYTPSSLSL